MTAPLPVSRTGATDREVEALAQRLQQADPDGIQMAATGLPPSWDDNPHVDREYYRTFAAALLAEQPGGGR